MDVKRGAAVAMAHFIRYHIIIIAIIELKIITSAQCKAQKTERQRRIAGRMRQ